MLVVGGVDLSGFVGVLAAGFLSDRLFGGRRALLSLIMLTCMALCFVGMYRFGASGVLAFAVKPVRSEHTVLEHGDVLGTLTLLGMVGMLDPPRADAMQGAASVKQSSAPVAGLPPREREPMQIGK